MTNYPPGSHQATRALGVIPARYASTRFPGKPLQLIAGIPMVVRVARQAMLSSLDRVLVATDHSKIQEVCQQYGIAVQMTSSRHRNGTERLAQVARAIPAEIYVNVQGDEPLIEPALIDSLLESMLKDPTVLMATAARPVGDPRVADDPGVAKVVMDLRGDALFFSRAPIPRQGKWHSAPGETAGGSPICHAHVGIYAYRRDALLRLAALSPTPLEMVESLEQLRALEHGMKIRVVETHHQSLGVDTPADLARVEAMLLESGGLHEPGTNAVGTGRTDVIQEIRSIIELEREGLREIQARLDSSVVRAVELLLNCQGRVIVTGMGKSGLVARKVAATLASTGTPATFLHPADAWHGDLGLVSTGDLLMVFCNSGETDEVLRLLPHFKRMSASILSLTGKPASTLAAHSDVVLDVAVSREADPMDLVPTASTTAMLAMGDALATVLVKMRGFGEEQFAIFHPGGSLGRRLSWTVEDLMHRGDALPLVRQDTRLRKALETMSSKRLGSLFVVDAGRVLKGIFTDGDLRRLLQQQERVLDMEMGQVMIRTPRTITADALAATALRLMEDAAITILPVLDGQRRPVGAVHMHDLVRVGLA